MMLGGQGGVGRSESVAGGGAGGVSVDQTTA